MAKQEEFRLLHIYAQEHEHDDAYIVGNAAGLCALINALCEALVKGPIEVEAFVTDGEGYAVRILHDDSGWQDDFWTKLARPYTGEIIDYAKERREDAVWPHQLSLWP